jgi:hypothetical protein
MLNHALSIACLYQSQKWIFQTQQNLKNLIGNDCLLFYSSATYTAWTLITFWLVLKELVGFCYFKIVTFCLNANCLHAL